MLPLQLSRFGVLAVAVAVAVAVVVAVAVAAAIVAIWATNATKSNYVSIP